MVVVRMLVLGSMQNVSCSQTALHHLEHSLILLTNIK